MHKAGYDLPKNIRQTKAPGRSIPGKTYCRKHLLPGGVQPYQTRSQTKNLRKEAEADVDAADVDAADAAEDEEDEEPQPQKQVPKFKPRHRVMLKPPAEWREKYAPKSEELQISNPNKNTDEIVAVQPIETQQLQQKTWGQVLFSWVGW